MDTRIDTRGRPRHERESDHPGVLVLDPDAHAREIARAALELAGLRVIAAATGSAALAALREAPPEQGESDVTLVVGELYMPAAGEPCALRAVKRDAALSRLPFLVYTARVLPADRAWALANGCDAYLAKPAAPAALRKEVARLVGRAPGD
jgi:CheY-like chemotaxis protein